MEYYTQEEINSNYTNIKKVLNAENAFNKHFVKHFHKIIHSINQDSKILEIGPGSGTLLSFLIENNYKNLYAIDIDDYIEDSLKHSVSFNKCNASYEKFPFESKSIDIVMSIQVIEHLENPWNMVREVERILKQDGLFIISFPSSKDIFSRILFLEQANVYSYTSYNNHISFFTQAIQDKLFKNFEIINEYYTKSPLKRLQRLQNYFNLNIQLPAKKIFSVKNLYVMEKIR